MFPLTHSISLIACSLSSLSPLRLSPFLAFSEISLSLNLILLFKNSSSFQVCCIPFPSFDLQFLVSQFFFETCIVANVLLCWCSWPNTALSWCKPKSRIPSASFSIPKLLYILDACIRMMCFCSFYFDYWLLMSNLHQSCKE